MINKLFLLSILVCLLYTNNYSASLIYKATKNVKSNDLTDLVSIETGKFNQVKILIKFEGEKIRNPAEAPLLELARNELARKQRLLETGDISYSEVEIAKKRVQEYENNYVFAEADLKFSAIEGEDLITFSQLKGNLFEKLISLPPTKLKISTQGIGKYSIFIWGAV